MYYDIYSFIIVNICSIISPAIPAVMRGRSSSCKCLSVMVARIKEYELWVEIPSPLPSIKYHSLCFIVCTLHEVDACWIGRQACMQAGSNRVHEWNYSITS